MTALDIELHRFERLKDLRACKADAIEEAKTASLVRALELSLAVLAIDEQVAAITRECEARAQTQQWDNVIYLRERARG